MAAALAARHRTERRLLLVPASLIPLLGSMLAPEVWPASASVLFALSVFALLGGVDRAALRDVWLATSLGVGAAALLMVAIALAGGSDSRHAILGALALGWPRAWRLACIAPALALGAWSVLWLAVPGKRRANRALSWGFVGVAALVLAARLVWVASYASLPADLMVWSEPPFLLDLLKLRTGHVLYGPMQDVNSYPYAPLLQLMHHALLAPFRLDLSLMANRALAVAWQLASAAVLVWALWPRVIQALGRRALSWLVLLELLLLAVGSSFIAPYVHPDHALMLCFALAIGAVLAERRMPRPVFVLLLLTLPALATALKLTGAGIGLGLVLVMLVERRWRDLRWLALAAAIALGVIPLFALTLGEFPAWGIRLFASQPLRWHRLYEVLLMPAGRLALLAAVVLVAARRCLGRKACLGAERVAWLSAGFVVASLPAFLKVGGRENDLTPLAIAATVVLVLATAGVARRIRSRVVAPATALGVALVLVPPAPPCPGTLRTRLSRAEHTLETLLQSETRAGHRTLLYTSTLAWINAGRRDIPLDRAQSAVELSVAEHPALAAHWARLDRRYDSVITLGEVFQRGEPSDERFVALLEKHLRAHYVVASPPRGSPSADPTVVLLFRRVRKTPH